MPDDIEYLKLAEDWLRRQPAQSPCLATRHADDAQLVVAAYEIISALVRDVTFQQTARDLSSGQNIRFLERKIRSRDALIHGLEGKLDAIADALEEHGFDIALIPVVDAVKNLIRYHEELQAENDRLAGLVLRYLKEAGVSVNCDADATRSPDGKP